MARAVPLRLTCLVSKHLPQDSEFSTGKLYTVFKDTELRKCIIFHSSAVSTRALNQKARSWLYQMQCYTLATKMNNLFFNRLKRNPMIPLPTFLLILVEEQLGQGGHFKIFLLPDLGADMQN